MFNFKKFEGTNSRFEDRITVTKSKSIGFPTKFYQDNNLSNYKYVVLYYDVDQKAIGIQFTNSAEEKHKFSIAKSIKYGGGIVATSFFRTHKIDTAIYRGRYNWEKVPQDGIGDLFVIKLVERVEG